MEQLGAISRVEFDSEVVATWLDQQALQVRRQIAIGSPSDIFEASQGNDGSALAGPALCICSVVRIRERNLLLLPTVRSMSTRGAFGRTTILLALLGLDVPYTRLVNATAYARFAPVRLHLRNSAMGHALIASDRAYLTVDAQGVAATPIRIEPIDFAWDTARHLFRSSRLDYFPGMHRDPRYRPQLMYLFSRLRLDKHVLDRYASDWKSSQRIHEIAILTLDEGCPTGVQRVELRERNWVSEALDGFRFTATHVSSFWKRRREATERFIREVAHIGHIGETRLFRLRIQHRLPVFSRELFRDVADTLTSGVERSTRSQYSSIVEALCGGKKVSLITIAGKEFLGDRDFWEALAMGTSEGAHASIFLPDPSVMEASLRPQVCEGIKLIIRMLESGRATHRNFALALFRCRARFELAFVEDECCLLLSDSGQLESRVVERNDSDYRVFRSYADHVIGSAQPVSAHRIHYRRK